MQRLFLIRRLIRDCFGEQPNNDTNITDSFVNALLNEGIALAIKQNWKESIQLDGIAYINDSFITTYKGLAVTSDEAFMYKVSLPAIPLALGRNEGVKSLKFKNAAGKLSRECIPLNSSQKTFLNYRVIPNRILYYYEGNNIFAQSTLLLSVYSATVSLISAGNTDLSSEINLPEDYLSVVTGYVSAILMRERQVPKDVTADGVDN